RAGLFADSDHLRHHVWEHLGRFQRIDEAFATLNAGPHLCNRLLDDHVARSLCSDVQRLQDRHTGREQSRKRSRKARDGDLAENVSYDRQLEKYAVDDFSSAWCFVIKLTRNALTDHRS